MAVEAVGPPEPIPLTGRSRSPGRGWQQRQGLSSGWGCLVPGHIPASTTAQTRLPVISPARPPAPHAPGNSSNQQSHTLHSHSFTHPPCVPFHQNELCPPRPGSPGGIPDRTTRETASKRLREAKAKRGIVFTSAKSDPSSSRFPAAATRLTLLARPSRRGEPVRVEATLHPATEAHSRQN